MNIHSSTHAAFWSRTACAVLVSMALATPAVANNAALVLSVQGVGEQRNTLAAPWVLAAPQSNVVAGGFVRTGAASKMGLLLADQTQIRLNQNSVLQVRQLAQADNDGTRLSLSAGRAWSQSKRPPGNTLQVDTPAANAAIRGTSWDLEVTPEGNTLLTVFSGTVDFFNEQGALSVQANQAALARPGQAPVRLVLTNPRDRVQWVNAISVDPTRHLNTAEQQDPTWLPVVQALLQGQLAQAQSLLNALPASIQSTHPAYPLLQADMALYLGEWMEAQRVLTQAVERLGPKPQLLAHLARVQMFNEQLELAERTLQQGAQHTTNPKLLLAQAELQRRVGNAPQAIEQFKAVQKIAPTEDRAYGGLGSVYTELEDATPARQQLEQAATLRPDIATYPAERGTLETFANQFGQAQQAFDKALQINPGDYVALTGLGLMQLKQGQTTQALETFLKAGLMAPDYARAKAYTGVAYYQLGRMQDAINTLQEVTQLDDKDPVPYLFLSQIYTDLFEPEKALQASRAAVVRMPNLKSANQLASDQKGNANLGNAIAFFGLEDWALELAQDSYYPFWGGSHLFLADRYEGEFNKNTELFQGFLTDPLAFGASPRFSSLLRRPGHHTILGYTEEKERYRIYSPNVTFNGLSMGETPVAYFGKYNWVGGTFPVSQAAGMQLDPPAGVGINDTEADIWTVGLGVQATPDLGVFVYSNKFNLDLQDRNEVFNLSFDPQNTRFRNQSNQTSAGFSYRWKPQSQTWVKFDVLDNLLSANNFPILQMEADTTIFQSANFVQQTRTNGFQLKHIEQWSPGLQLNWGLEYGRARQNSTAVGEGIFLVLPANGELTSGLALLEGRNNSLRLASTAYAGAQLQVNKQLSLQGTLVQQQNRIQLQGQTAVDLPGFGTLNQQTAGVSNKDNELSPRLGLVFKPNAKTTWRLAYQDFIRPLSNSTLMGITTAGIPVDDVLLQAGGRAVRKVVQVHLNTDEKTQWFARLDDQAITNPSNQGVNLQTPSLSFLEELRSVQLVNLSNIPLYERTNAFQRGELQSATFGVNRVLNRSWSAYSRVVHTESKVLGPPNNLTLPSTPKNAFVMGSTWAGPERVYLSGRAVYRSSVFSDATNLAEIPQRWGMDLAGFWESPTKTWLLGAGALNIGRNSSTFEVTRYIIDVRYRF